MDTSLHSDLVPRFERFGGSGGGVCVAQDLHVGKADPVGHSFALPHALDVQIIQTVVVQLMLGERGRGKKLGKKDVTLIINHVHI